MPPAAIRLAISAMPTGSLAPDSPSRMVPLRPATSRCPSTENTTAGIGRGDRGGDQQRGIPAQPERAVQEAAPRRRGEEGAQHADHERSARPRRGTVDHPMCMPPSNRMHEQRHRDQALDQLLGRVVQVGNHLHRHRGGDQHQQRRRDPDPLGEPVGQQRQQPPAATSSTSRRRYRCRTSHSGAARQDRTGHTADQASRHTARHRGAAGARPVQRRAFVVSAQNSGDVCTNVGQGVVPQAAGRHNTAQRRAGSTP